MKVAPQNYHLGKELVYFFIAFGESSQTKLEMRPYKISYFLFLTQSSLTHQLDHFQKPLWQDEYCCIGNNPLNVLKALKKIPREKLHNYIEQ